MDSVSPQPKKKKKKQETYSEIGICLIILLSEMA
jgi:hypothetical protein